MDRKISEITSEEMYKQYVEEIKRHDKLYYEKCEPEISDYEYDLLVKAVEKYEKKNPEKLLKKSPTQKVSESTTKGFKSIKHVKPMLSLSNTYSKEEVKDFIDRVYKLSGRKDIEFCIELKIDGTAISIRYEEGKLVRAITRGNGKIGDDVTENIKMIKTLPHKLSGNFPKILEIRGEVFMAKDVFYSLNQKRKEDSLTLFANPRNAAAGSLKILDPKEVAKRNLNLICYNIAEPAGEISSQYKVHKYLKKMGVPVADEKYYTKAKTIEEIFVFAEKISFLREKLFYEIDGIVIKVDDLSLNELLGMTGKSPRYATAYKFAPEQAYSEILDITVQVGRTGVLTPVAELKPTLLAGSRISRATLHNEDEIKRKDIRIGDHVVIEKGGDVIPKVVLVDKSKRKKDAIKWHMPKKCPICNATIEKKEGEVAFRCINPNCFGRKLRHLIYFASKHAMDIENLGEKIVKRLVDLGLISNPSDIYHLQKSDIEKIEGFKEKSTENLLSSIEKSKNCSLARFIMALEIPYVGTETAEIIADEIEKINDLEKFSLQELENISQIGNKIAKSIYDFFHEESNLLEIKRLLEAGVNPQKQKTKKIENPFFKDKTFVLTGTLGKYSREMASKLIKERKGKTSSSISKKTDYLLAGKDPGSKFQKAEKLNVKIINEEEFEKKL